MCRNYRKLFSILIVLLMLCSLLTGCMQKDTFPAVSPASAVTLEADQDNIMNIISELTSERFQGRLAGTKENQLAAEYIADYFKEVGLESPKGLDSYMQPYKQPSIILSDKPVLQVVDKNGKVLNDFNYTENFVLRRLSSETEKIDMKSTMYLIEKPEQLSVENKKLKDKVILLPWEYYDMLRGQNNPADFAEMYGAKAVISEFDLAANTLGYSYLKIRPLAEEWMTVKAYKPFAFVDSDTFSKLEVAAKAGNRLHFSCNSEKNFEGVVNNVIGIIPGSDPVLKENYIIIGAHFDHLGSNMNGSYNPGTLDNATGTAVMMELASAIKKGKTPPKQSVMFIALNGEESGLCGAKGYCKNPVSPLKKAVMINLDMIGSASKTPLTIAVVSASSNKSLRNDFVNYADKLGIDFKTDYEDASDHAVFDHYGVPSVCLINLDTKYGYHSPQDTMKAIDGTRVNEIAQLVLEYIANKAY